MKNIILNIIILLSFNIVISQTTTQVTISNGDGWYRIIEGSWQASDLVKISGISGNNKVTNLTMYVSLMAYDQGGSINIINNSFYNSNHIEEIRGGTSNGKYVLDVHLVGINNPTNMSITTNSIIPLSTPIYNPTDNLTGKIEISGKVIGTESTRHPIYFSKNVGIGTPNPTKKLEIKGNEGVGIRLFNQNANTWDILNSQYGKLDFVRGSSNIFMRIDQNGNVGIGTPNPGAWRLAVNGNIRAKEVKVETGWSDFVFYDDYELPTLKEVEKYIEEKGHLKDIPSAKEVAENGIFLGEMDAKLLQKIEELTLYTIQQQKEIEELKVQNKKLLDLQLRLEKLESEK